MRFQVLFLILSSFLISSCALFQSRDVYQTGTASWYGKFHQGKKTASGEIFNMNDFTAAHRKLPFGTRIHVKSLTTGKTVTVRINDRGPFSGNRILDLSFAAAEKLGIVQMGEDEVEIRLR